MPMASGSFLSENFVMTGSTANQVSAHPTEMCSHLFGGYLQVAPGSGKLFSAPRSMSPVTVAALEPHDGGGKLLRAEFGRVLYDDHVKSVARGIGYAHVFRTCLRVRQ